jgi:hypothetical protein
MILGAVFLLLATVLGAAALTLVDRQLGIVERVAGGIVLGTALLAWVTLGVALAVGLNPWLSLVLALAGAAAGVALVVRAATPGALLGIPRDAEQLRALARREAGPFLLLLGALALSLLIHRSLVIVTPDGLATGIITDNWSSLPMSLGVIASFAWGGNLPPENPVMAGVRLSYHFLTDFAAAILVQLGMDLFTAIVVQTVVLTTATLVVVFAFARRLGDGPGAAVLAVALVVAAGGLGFIYFFRDAAARPGPWWGILLGLPRQYTHMGPELIRWGAPLINHAIPDRSLLYGLPLAALVFHLCWAAVSDRGRLPLAAAGIVVGLLPLFSVQAFFAAIAVALPLAAMFRTKEWAWYFGAAAVLALPALLWLAPRGIPILSDLGSLLPGPAPATSWAAVTIVDLAWPWSAFNLGWWWLKNLGLFPIVLGFALASGALPRPARGFTAGLLACLGLRLLFGLTPWSWEANRMLLFWLVGSAPLVAVFLLGLFACGHTFHRLTTSAVLVSLLLSGALDVWRAATPGMSVHPEFDRDGVALGQFLRESLPEHAVVLTGLDHNSPVILSGRPRVFGYPGHFTQWGLQGLDVRQRDLGIMLRGEPDAPRLLAQYRVRYAVIGPDEVDQARANLPFFEATMRKVADLGKYRVFRARW